LRVKETQTTKLEENWNSKGRAGVSKPQVILKFGSAVLCQIKGKKWGAIAGASRGRSRILIQNFVRV